MPEIVASEPARPAIRKKSVLASNLSLPERFMQCGALKLACRRHRPDCLRDLAGEADAGITRTGCFDGMARMRRQTIASEDHLEVGQV